MGSKTKIDWCDASWNPVTGCLHGCDYCYARKMAYRFGSVGFESNTENGYECDLYEGTGENHVLNSPTFREWKNGRTTKAPYPFCFDPTFHHYKLVEPQHWKKPRNIFVCSMADLFGEWVPDEWIQEVFKAREAAPQHRYLFLTKNPQRYNDLMWYGKLPKRSNFWYGGTRTGVDGVREHEAAMTKNTFLSVEPLLAPMERATLNAIEMWDWIIVGAETGNRKGKVVPKREWVEEIAEACAKADVPLFMKGSLQDLMGDDFRQEYPWENGGADDD